MRILTRKKDQLINAIGIILIKLSNNDVFFNTIVLIELDSVKIMFKITILNQNKALIKH